MNNLRKRNVGELTFTFLLVAFSLFMLYQAYSISKFESLTSAGSFPMFAAVVMLIAGLIIASQTVRTSPSTGVEGESLPKRFVRQITPPVVMGFTLSIAIYMALLNVLGFVISSYLFLVVSMWLLGSRKILLNLVVSALSLAAIYVIFQTVFSVVLPTGTLLKGLMS